MEMCTINCSMISLEWALASLASENWKWSFLFMCAHTDMSSPNSKDVHWANSGDVCGIIRKSRNLSSAHRGKILLSQGVKSREEKLQTMGGLLEERDCLQTQLIILQWWLIGVILNSKFLGLSVHVYYGRCLSADISAICLPARGSILNWVFWFHLFEYY